MSLPLVDDQKRVIVKFIAPRPERYYRDNFNPVEYTPGELYQVPWYVARGMLERGWAEVVSKDEADQMVGQAPKPPQPEPDPRPEPRPAPPPVREPDSLPRVDEPPPWDENNEEEDAASKPQFRNPRPRRRHEQQSTS